MLGLLSLSLLSLLLLCLLGLLCFLLQLFEPLQQLPVGCPVLVAVQAVTAASTQLFSIGRFSCESKQKCLRQFAQQ